MSYIQVVVGGNARLCNHKCYFCDVKETKGFKDMGPLNIDAMEASVISVADREKASTIVITGRGEPTIHPTFNAVVDALIDAKRFFMEVAARDIRIELHTNGTNVPALMRLPDNVHIVLSDAVKRHMYSDSVEEHYNKVYGVHCSKRPWEEAAEALKRAGRKFSFNVIVLGYTERLRYYIEDLDTKYEPVLINVRPVAGKHSNWGAQETVDGLDDTDLPVVRRNCNKSLDKRPYIVTQDGKVYRDWNGGTT